MAHAQVSSRRHHRPNFGVPARSTSKLLILLLSVTLLEVLNSSPLSPFNHHFALCEPNHLPTVQFAQTPSVGDRDSYIYNLHQYQQQQQQSLPGPVDSFITSENFGPSQPSEFDSVNAFTSRESAESRFLNNHQRRLNSPAVNALHINSAAKHHASKDDHLQSESAQVSKLVTVEKCEHYLPSSGELSNFSSPGYGSSGNPPNLNCIYRIAPQDPTVCKLELEFVDFQLNSSDSERDPSERVESEFGRPSTQPNDCKGDFLEFNDQKRFCATEWKGRKETVQIDPQEDVEFIFRFVTGPRAGGKGFNINYKPLPGSCATSKSASKRHESKDRMKNSSSNLIPTIQMLGSPSNGLANSREQRHTEIEFDIKSEGFPTKNYTNNLDCVHYVIRASPQICGLELRFIKFQLEPSEGCAYDFLEVDGESFCGTLPDGSRNIFRFSEGEVKTISFQTDSKGVAPGFHIKVRQLSDCDNAFIPTENRMTYSGQRTQKCNFVSAEREARMTSVKYPAPYPDDLLCAYTIEKPKSPGGVNFCSVELRFTEFDLQPSEDCSEDFLELQNHRHCGRSLNGTSKIVPFNDDGYVKFLFRSDSTGSTDSKGFALNYTQIECIESKTSAASGEQSPKASSSENVMKVAQKDPKAKQGQKLKKNAVPIGTTGRSVNGPAGDRQARNQSYFYRDPCFKLYSEKRFMLSTELTNGTYKENLDCLYTIRKHSAKVCYVEIHFRHFDLEASPDCQYDYVEIGNAVRLCGSLQQETSRIYRFEKPELYVTFHTDASTERSGFRLEVHQLECEGDRIVRETSEENGTSGPGKTSHSEDSDSKDSLQSLEHAQHESRTPDDRGRRLMAQNDSQLIQQESIASEFDLFGGGGVKTPHFDSQRILGPKFEKADFYCSKILDSKEFFIHSPGYPSHYSPDLDCLYMIRPYRPTVCKLEVNFDHFELQPFDFSKNCLKSDFLDIDSREQLCGKMAESQSKMFPFLNSTFFIHFHSDSFRTSFDKGFRLFVRQIDCDSGFGIPQLPQPLTGNGKQPSPGFSRCNKIFTTSAFELKSPLYPTTYLSNSFCQYRVIKLRSDSLKICYLEVAFKDFDLQDSVNCSKDYVSMNGIKLCGPIVRDSVRLFPFYGNEFLITFSTDRTVNGKGFHLQIRQNECHSQAQQLPEPLDPSSVKRPSLPPSPSSPTSGFFSNFQILQTNQLCQQVHSSMVFELESPNYPNYYLPGLSCGYTIRKRGPTICQLEVYFVELDVEPSIGCRTDYLLVDGVKYCNLNPPPGGVLQLPFFELEKRILFRSGEFRNRKGFLAQVRQIDCASTFPKPFITPNEIAGTPSAAGPTSPAGGLFPPEKFIFLPSLPSICEICVTEVTGHLQSYDYPNFYPPNVNCTYRVTPLPHNCMVQMRFDEFDFDYSPECTRDYLEINGVRYCGSQLKGVAMILLNKRKEDLSIRMISHSRGAIVKPSFRGFRASYTQLPCLGTSGEVDPSTSKSRPPSLPARMDQQRPMEPPAPPTKTSPTTPQVVSKPEEPKAPHPTKTPTQLPSEYVQDAIYCDASFDSSHFEIKSPGYPYRYFDNLNCAYKISKSSANVCRLRLTFDYFNVVGEDGTCRGDYLDVFNSKICGVLERFTKKEIPFLHEKILLNFHTNSARTANGFHLTIDQIDCISGGPDHPPPAVPVPDHHEPSGPSPTKDPYEILSKTHSHQEPSPGRVRPPPSHFVLQQQRQEVLKYDDDDIVSEFDQSKKTVSKTTPMSSSTSYVSSATTPVITPSPTTRRPTSRLDVEPHVIYEQERDGGRPMGPPSGQATKGMSPPSGASSPAEGSSTYPLRYFSRNITVLNGDSQTDHRSGSSSSHGSSRTRPDQVEQRRWESTKGGSSVSSIVIPEQPSRESRPSSGICEQLMVEAMYFELSSADLQMDPTKGGAASTCQLHVKKAKPNICQLDIHFVRYWNNNDTTCGQQYLSVDGERICGFVPANTIKKFWFVRPDLYLFVKLLKGDRGEHFGEEPFVIKARQVECAHNLEQQGSEMQVRGQDPRKDSRPGDSARPQDSRSQLKSPKYNFYEQQQMLDRSDHEEQPTYHMVQRPMEPQRPTHPAPMDSEYNDYCDIIATELQYKIVSPRSPGPHRCRYTIRKVSPSICGLDIKFAMFRLEEEQPNVGNRCKNEYLEIDSGKICGAFPVGHERRYHFLPDQQEKFVYFYSNRSNQVPGDFVLHVKQIEDCSKPLKSQKPTLSMPTICDTSSRAVRGQLKSPNYPAPYDDFTRCTYRIQAASPDYCSLRLVIKDLDIERDVNSRFASDCEKDSLELTGDIKLCGRDLAKKEYLIPFEHINGQRMAQMRFFSDSNGNGRGFSLDYSQELCTGRHTSSGKTGPGGSAGAKGRPSSPIIAGKTQFIPMHQTQPSSDANSLSRNPMRPHYPPNYVSKAHLLKSMDRKQFIKLMLMEEERDRLRMRVGASKDKPDVQEPEGQMKLSEETPQEEKHLEKAEKKAKTPTTTLKPMESTLMPTTTANPKMTITTTMSSPVAITTVLPEEYATEIVTFESAQKDDASAMMTTTTQSSVVESTTKNGDIQMV